MKNHTIRALGRRFKLSRSTLLYYDRIKLLSPSGRSAAGYRLYSEPDAERLARIMLYREAGLPLEAIRELLEGPQARGRAALTVRLQQINDEIAALREQQRLLAHLIGDPALARDSRAMDKQGWVALLRASGLDEEDMARWHRQFELRAPEAHQDFLEALGIDPGEVAAIRKWSRPGG